ncbi:MAG: hypothetical protein HQK58_08160, partial [Deltaproteobacteria bacterium]|nr:hypothetical protein [Deltaproteobacteria bacterium]
QLYVLFRLYDPKSHHRFGPKYWERQLCRCLLRGHGGTNITTNGQWIINEELEEALDAEFGAGVLKQQGGDQLLNINQLET